MNRWNAVTTPFRQGRSGKVLHTASRIECGPEPCGLSCSQQATDRQLTPDLNGQVPTPRWRQNGRNVRKRVFLQIF
jgi:hypothetical protein